jgi:hypothetical protein
MRPKGETSQGVVSRHLGMQFRGQNIYGVSGDFITNSLAMKSIGKIRGC